MSGSRSHSTRSWSN